MKIRSIRLFDYNQFKDLTIDLTYPTGHTNAGQPLEKVCIIGQSGTGKTTILNFLSNLLKKKGNIEASKYHAAFDHNSQVILINKDKNRSPTVSNTSRSGQGTRVLNTDLGLNLLNDVFASSLLAMYLPADFLSNNNDKTDGVIDDGRNFYDFKDVNIRKIWHKILDEVKTHQKIIIELKDRLEEIHKKSNKTIDEIRKERDPIEERLSVLEREDTNPLKKLANDYLDVVLSNFNLKVDTDLSVSENLDKIEFIRIKDNKGKIIPNGYLSTGTAQFLLSSLPFYLLKPKNAVVLFDEPERSLYPDIQKLLVDHYSKFAPMCQFIYATHSPIVASCFEPWEVVELKFGADGYVYQQQYYEGERHVNNYNVHPKYLTYDLILKEVFNVQNTDGENRSRNLLELIMLENQLKQYKVLGDNASDQFQQTMSKYKELGELLSWTVKFN